MKRSEKNMNQACALFPGMNNHCAQYVTGAEGIEIIVELAIPLSCFGIIKDMLPSGTTLTTIYRGKGKTVNAIESRKTIYWQFGMPQIMQGEYTSMLIGLQRISTSAKIIALQNKLIGLGGYVTVDSTACATVIPVPDFDFCV